MPLTDEQAEAVKKQILKQVDNLPEDKQEQIRKYILEMNNEQLEEFLEKNQQMQQESGENNENAENKETQCIMCAISSKKIDSIHIYENEEYLAVLELNPLSEGHTLLIPKKHTPKIKDIPKASLVLAKKIGKKLVKKLSAKNIRISSSDELGHAIINIIPLYEGKEITERKPAKRAELKELKEKIGEIKIKSAKKTPKESKEKEVKKLVEEIIKLPRRIP